MDARGNTSCLGLSKTASVEVLSRENLPGDQKPGSMGDDSLAVPSHPLGVKPAGNAYAATEDIKSAAGLFATLPDELLVQTLESLDAASLRQVEHSCKALYAFARLDDLWKTLCTE